jgi:MFS family permease
MTNRVRTRLERGPLLTAVVYTGTGMLPIFLISTQVLQIEADIGFGVAELALATTCFFAAAALASNVGGGIVSRLGPSVGIRLGSSMTIIACVVAGLAVVPWMIPVAAVFGGIGNGVIQVGSNVAIFDGVRPERMGLAFGAKQASVPTASIIAGLSLPVIGLVFGWRWVFAGAVVLALVLAVSTPELRRSGEPGRVEQRLGRPSRSMLWLGLAGMTGAAAGSGLSLFIVPSAVDIGISEAAAGGVLAFCSLLVVVWRVGAGFLVDRRRSSGHVEMACMAGLGALATLVLMTATAPPLYLASMPLALLGSWGWPGIIFYTLVTTYPEMPAKASGMLLSGNLTGTLAGPLVVGSFAGRGNYPGAWLFVSICAALAAVGFVVAWRTTEPARLSR